MITLLDNDRSETYSTLDEAIASAQTWYRGLADNRMPTWNYRIDDLQGFRRAVRDYKTQVAKYLGAALTGYISELRLPQVPGLSGIDDQVEGATETGITREMFLMNKV